MFAAALSAPPTVPFPEVLDRLLDRRELGEPEAQGLMDQILQGELGPERLAAVVTALRAKAPCAAELVGFARALRAHAQPLPHTYDLLLDTCGTGGAPQKSFNVSTATALLTAAAGVAVAKHGNRSVTRPSGSADVLETAGARLDLTANQAMHVLDATGFTFLYAPAFHPAMRHAAPVRKALGIRTVFNLLGPLSNPAAATHQVLGVHDVALLRPMAEALARLGIRGGYVMHTEPGYDEAMPTGLVRSIHLRDGAAGPLRSLDPETLGLARIDPAHLAPAPAGQALAAVHDGLAGRGARGDAVALNAAFALTAVGASRSLSDGLALARQVQADGTARAKLDAFVAATRSV